MRSSRPRPPRAALLGALLLGVLPVPGRAQEREVVSKQVAVGKGEASLHLEFDQGSPLDVSLKGGQVRVDGKTLGRYQDGDALDASWRELVGRAVSLEDGALAAALRSWQPPAGSGQAADVGRSLDRALEDALQPPAAPPTPAATADVPGTAEAPSPPSGPLLRSLLRRSDRLRELADAVNGLDLGEAGIHLDEDVTVGPGETVDHDLIVVDGDVTVEGDVDGDVVLVGGTLDLRDGGRITGDVRLAADARLDRNGGDVEGSVENIEATAGSVPNQDELRRRIRQQVEREVRAQMEDSDSRDFARRYMTWSPLRSVGRGLGGLMENLVSILVLGVLLGGLAIHFAPDNLEVVTRTVRRSPMRTAMVGVAGAFVALPAWILGCVALAVSIVGILAIPFWILLFPVAVALAMALGYVASAQIVGEWVARQHIQRLEWVRVSNPYSTVIAGVAALMTACMLANVLQMAGPWTGIFQGLLTFIGVMATLAAALMGFGAVLLTRGGRQPEYPDGGFDDWDMGGLGDMGPTSPPSGPSTADPGGAGATYAGPEEPAADPGATPRGEGEEGR